MKKHVPCFGLLLAVSRSNEFSFNSGKDIFRDFDLKDEVLMIVARYISIENIERPEKSNQSVERYDKKRIFLKYRLLLIKHPNRQ